MKLSYTQETALYNIAEGRLPWDNNLGYRTGYTLNKLKKEGLICFSDLLFELTEKGKDWIIQA